jgi:hypothetical protein
MPTVVGMAKKKQGRTPTQLSKREKELYRIVHHTLYCFEPGCGTCMGYETKLEDGPQHFPEDPAVRLKRLGVVLDALCDQAKRIENCLEGAPVSNSVRVAAFEMGDMSRVARTMLTEPIYSSGHLTAEKGASHDSNRKAKDRPRKRAVTLHFSAGRGQQQQSGQESR